MQSFFARIKFRDFLKSRKLVTIGCLLFFYRYTRQVIDETLRASVLAPWGARIHEFDLQVGEFVIPKEVTCIILYNLKNLAESNSR